MANLFKNKIKISSKTRSQIVNMVRLPYLNLIYLSIGINVVSIVGILIFKNFIPPEVPLFYGLAEGSGQLAHSDELIIPSMVALLVILVNISLTSVVENEYLKRTLIVMSLIVTLLSLITTLEIVFLVGNF